MLELRTISAVRKGHSDAVIVATVTRGGRLPYLKRTWESVLGQRPGVPVHYMMAANAPDDETMAWLESHRRRFEFVSISPYNRGQNIPINEMLQLAMRMEVGWFIRVDDDCFFERPVQWLKHMLSVQRYFAKSSGQYVVMGPLVKGLRNPIPSHGTTKIRAGKAEIVPILGGICRMMPMSLMRYFRFNERMPMGSGEAMQLANFCAERNIPLIRDCTMTVTHGVSTDEQEAGDADWSYEHAMLQSLPFGL